MTSSINLDNPRKACLSGESGRVRFSLNLPVVIILILGRLTLDLLFRCFIPQCVLFLRAAACYFAPQVFTTVTKHWYRGNWITTTTTTTETTLVICINAYKKCLSPFVRRSINPGTLTSGAAAGSNCFLLPQPRSFSNLDDLLFFTDVLTSIIYTHWTVAHA